MTQAKRSIFRASAWQHYIQRQERAELPRYIRPPAFTLLWILLGLLFIASGMAWCGEVPIYATGPAILRASKAISAPGVSRQSGMVAVVFLPADRSLPLHPNQPVYLQIGSTGLQITGTAVQVAPGILSPQQARQRYRLDSSEGLLITQPSRVVIASVSAPLAAQAYTGSIGRAQVWIGSQRLLTLLLGTKM